MPCPVCQQIMRRQQFAAISGVIIDYCGEHGFWFDPDELEDIARFIEAGGLHFAVSAKVSRDRAVRRRKGIRRARAQREARKRNDGGDLFYVLAELISSVLNSD